MADEKPTKRKIKEAFDFEGGDLLKKILEKHPSGISEEERAVLKARRSYLTDQQLKDFDITDEVDEDEGKTLAEMNTKELKAIAKSKKIKLKRGIKDAEIIKLIEAFDAENEEDEDEDDDEE